MAYANRLKIKFVHEGGCDSETVYADNMQEAFQAQLESLGWTVEKVDQEPRP